MQRRKVLLCLGLAGLLGLSPLHTFAEEINGDQAITEKTMGEETDTEITEVEEPKNVELEEGKAGAKEVETDEEDTKITEEGEDTLIDAPAVEVTETVDSIKTEATEAIKASKTETTEIEVKESEEPETVVSESEIMVTGAFGKEVEKEDVLTDNVSVETAEEGEVDINEANFPSENFRAYISENFDKDHNGILSIDERESVESIRLESESYGNLDGLWYFPKLTTLSCYGCDLTSLDVSRNSSLKLLECRKNRLTNLDVSQNPALIYLFCAENQLTNLDVSRNPALDSLDCSNNQLACLDISHNPALITSHTGWYGQKIVIEGNKIDMVQYDGSFDGSKVSALDGLSFSAGVFTLEDGKNTGSYEYVVELPSGEIFPMDVTIVGEGVTDSEEDNRGENDNDKESSSSEGDDNAGSSNKKNRRTNSGQTDTSIETVREIIGNRVKLSGGKVATSTVGGIYNAGSIAGAAVIMPKENVSKAAGLSDSDISSGTNISFYVCDSRNKERNAALKAIADSMGKKGVAYINVDMYSITRRGIVTAIRTASEPISIVFGIPTRVVNSVNNYSVICIDESGKTVVFSDMDTDDNTITIQTNVFGTYMIVY